MTDYIEVERLYKQYFNFEDQIKILIDEENFDEASSVVLLRNELLTKLMNARKTLQNLTEEQARQLKEFDKLLKNKNKSNIEFLKASQTEVDKELQSTQKKVKINTAYSMQTTQKQGVFLDVTE